jgi:hypothetical protein
MQINRVVTTLGVVAVLASAAGARAADANALRAKYDAAMAKVTSFELTITGPRSLSGVATYVKPDRVGITTAFGTSTSELVQVGQVVYTRDNGAAWDEHTVAAAVAKQQAGTLRAAPAAPMTALADRRENGVTVGAFRTEAAVPHDKATYLPRTCTMKLPAYDEPVTLTYAKWNDRTNLVQAPEAAK